MLLEIDLKAKVGERIRGVNLQSFGIDERTFQEILYHSLDKF